MKPSRREAGFARWLAPILVWSWVAGCAFEADYTGTSYRCDERSGCARGYVCLDSVCVTLHRVPDAGDSQEPPLTEVTGGADGASAQKDATTPMCGAAQEAADREGDGACGSTDAGTTDAGTADPGECDDGVRNQDETDVDCGGPCAPCPSCTDGIKNQSETGVDCGGPCSTCPSCADGTANQSETGIDCGGPCAPCAGCDDGIKNQGETGTDCGGPCAPCPSCNDGVANQGEKGVDCGGPCPTCPAPLCAAFLTYESDASSGYGPCEGDCDEDSDCAGNLKCFQVSSSNAGMRVPGCAGVTEDSTDYCYDPAALGITRTASFVHNDVLFRALRECEADCDADYECSAGLVCWQNESSSTISVPGCLGLHSSSDDYCVDPNKILCR